MLAARVEQKYGMTKHDKDGVDVALRGARGNSRPYREACTDAAPAHGHFWHEV
jgi:hypothetical protein